MEKKIQYNKTMDEVRMNKNKLNSIFIRRHKYKQIHEIITKKNCF